MANARRKTLRVVLLEFGKVLDAESKYGGNACVRHRRKPPAPSSVLALPLFFPRVNALKLGDDDYSTWLNASLQKQTNPQALPSPFSLAGAARSRALVAVRVSLAAAEKIGALSSVPSASHTTGAASSRREGMSSAIESMSSAIETLNTRPELYIARAGLLAMMDDGGGGKEGGERICSDYGQAAASDFATALWFSHSHD